jgi:archaemetzincin
MRGITKGMGAVAAVVLLAGSCLVARTARAGDVRVCILPLNPYDRDLQEVVRRGIQHLYGFEVRVLDPEPLPRSAFYPPRNRYRAEKLLDFLDGFAGADKGCQIVIGFTRADISTTKEPHADWGVFGLGTIGGPSCVVSTARLGQNLGQPRLLGMRTVKVVNHELGHALGLDHHPTPGCLMEDAKGTIRTVDRESGVLCPESRSWIEKTYGVSMRAADEIDWKVVLGDYLVHTGKLKGASPEAGTAPAPENEKPGTAGEHTDVEPQTDGSP